MDRTEDFPAAFEEALTAETPFLLELRVDPDVITPSARLSEIAPVSNGVTGEILQNIGQPPRS